VNVTPSTPGLVLLCDDQGIIQKVLHSSLKGSQTLTVGRSLAQMVEPTGLEKMLNFLVELRTQGAAFDWELNVTFAQQVTTLHVTGVTIEDGLLILGNESSQGLNRLYQETMRTNYGLLNTLRQTLEGQGHTRHPQESELYDELSRLNNELVTLQRELAKKNVELEKLNAQKNQFLGMASHDLRSPLAVMISYSEFLLDEAGDYLQDDHMEILSVIHSYSKFMLRLVTDLLDVSAIEAGKLVLELQPVDLVDLVRRNLALNKVLAARKEIELVLEGETNLPPMNIDGHKIEQVLNNLISNALKFSHPHSRVLVQMARSGEQVLVSVSDAGPGIPPQELDRLFEPFAKTSVRSTGGEKSTGLGLMIARKVIEAHHGQIGVESTVGVGTTFYFTLPLS
jgi:signal transduction histidine kinase